MLKNKGLLLVLLNGLVAVAAIATCFALKGSSVNAARSGYKPTFSFRSIFVDSEVPSGSESSTAPKAVAKDPIKAEEPTKPINSPGKAAEEKANEPSQPVKPLHLPEQPPQKPQATVDFLAGVERLFSRIETLERKLDAVEKEREALVGRVEKAERDLIKLQKLESEVGNLRAEAARLDEQLRMRGIAQPRDFREPKRPDAPIKEPTRVSPFSEQLPPPVSDFAPRPNPIRDNRTVDPLFSPLKQGVGRPFYN